LPPKLIKDKFKIPHITFNEDGTVNDFFYVDGNSPLHGAVDINYEGGPDYNPLWINGVRLD
jgi:hypothetical protein